MNIASLDNCKRLYELSGWETEDWYDLDLDGVPEEYLATTEDKIDDNDYIPAYTAGYLLRKLPKFGKYTTGDGNIERNRTRLTLTVADSGTWVATMDSKSEAHGWVDPQYADTPEDALCLLAIKLFEEGILTNEN